MKKVDVSELQGPLTELMDQVGGNNGRPRFEEFKLWLKGVVLSALEVLIDFSVPCKLPFKRTERMSPAKSGIVKLEKRGNDLYLDDARLELVFSENQRGGKVAGGHDLRKERDAAGDNVSASVLDKCVENPALWPESWKKNDQGNTIYVYFWDDIFRDPTSDSLCVRCGCWSEGEVVSNYDWLDDDWDGGGPAASRAS
ncbi:MAG: hypothetical protein AAB513_01395 [Patescibacteria group bacterium]